MEQDTITIQTPYKKRAHLAESANSSTGEALETLKTSSASQGGHIIYSSTITRLSPVYLSMRRQESVKEEERMSDLLLGGVFV